jgi:hypothetical protein
MHQIFARDPGVDEGKAVITGRSHRSRVRIGGPLAPAFLRMFHQLPEAAEALRSRRAADRETNGGEYPGADNKARLHDQSLVPFPFARFSLRQLNDS